MLAAVGMLAGFAAGTVTMPGAAEGTPPRAAQAEPEACRRRCFPFDPTEVVDGTTIKGTAGLGMDVRRVLRVRLFRMDAPGDAAKAFTLEWTRTGSITLCVEPKAQGDHGETIGDLCTRDSCLVNALAKAGHGGADVDR